MAQPAIPKIEVQTIDIDVLRQNHPKLNEQGKDNPFEPHGVVKRMGSVWYVRKVPVVQSAVGVKERWIPVRDGDLVRVPLLPYLIRSDNPRDTVAYAMGLAAITLTELSSNISDIIIMCGDVEDEYVEENLTGFRIWLGFAAKVRR